MIKHSKILKQPKFFLFTTAVSKTNRKEFFSSNSSAFSSKQFLCSSLLCKVTNPILLSLNSSKRCLTSSAKSQSTDDEQVEEVEEAEEAEEVEPEVEEATKPGDFTEIKKDLLQLIDNEIQTFVKELNEESEDNYALQFLEEYKFSTKVTDGKAHLYRDLENYIVNVNFVVNKENLSNISAQSDDEKEEEREEREDREDREKSEEDDTDFEGDDVIVSIQGQTANGKSNQIIQFECYIERSKLFINFITISNAENATIPSQIGMPDDFLYKENSIIFDHLSEALQTRMYDFLDEFGIGDKFVGFVESYREQKAAKNNLQVLKSLRDSLDVEEGNDK